MGTSELHPHFVVLCKMGKKHSQHQAASKTVNTQCQGHSST